MIAIYTEIEVLSWKIYVNGTANNIESSLIKYGIHLSNNGQPNCNPLLCSKSHCLLVPVGVGGADYVEVMETVMFGSGSVDGSMMCVNVEIMEDIEAELTESFSLHLIIEAGTSNVDFHIEWALVEILDNDSKSNL